MEILNLILRELNKPELTQKTFEELLRRPEQCHWYIG